MGASRARFEIRHEFRPSFARAVESGARLMGVFGPARTGKTSDACVWMYLMLRHFAAKYAPLDVRGAFIRDTYKSVRQTDVVTWRRLLPDPVAGSWNEQRATYTVGTPRGQKAEVVFLGLDSADSLKALQSLDLTLAVIEEPAGGIDETGAVMPGIPEVVFHTVWSRLSHPASMAQAELSNLKCLVIGNPPSKAHWCYRMFQPDAPQPTEGGRTIVGNVPKEESPLPGSYYDDLIRRYGMEHPYTRRFVFGEWLPALSGGWRWDMVPEVPGDDLPAFEAIIATLDPATGSKGGDFTALVVAGLEASGDATVLDLRVGRVGPETTVRWVLDVCQRWPDLVGFGFEAVAFQKWIGHLVQSEAERLGMVAPLLALERDTRMAKAERIQHGLGFRLAERRLKRRAGLDPQALAEWQRELEAFPEGTHDDVLDALADLDQVAMRSGARPVMLATGLDTEGIEADARRRAAEDMTARVRSGGGCWMPMDG